MSPDDGVIFNIPLRAAAANLVASGYLPLWNPYVFSGMPLHGAAQAGLLFPLNWFYLISSPRVATNLMMLSAYAVAAAGAYVYARRAGADLPGAIITSLIWQWCAFMVEQIGHTNILHTAALLPWLLWSIEGYLSTGRRKRGVLFVTLLALQVFAGHQQTFAYSLLLLAAYAFVIARTYPEKRKRSVSIAVFILAGLALAAVQILPTFELLRNSLRASATYEFFGSFSLPPRFLMTFFAPYVLGGGNGLIFRAPYLEQPFFGEYAAYAGIITLMLAAVAVVRRRDTRTKFWSIVFLLALLLATGRFIPFRIYELLYYVPVLNLFRGPTRHLMEVHFALAVLAGRGLTALRANRKAGMMQVSLIAGAVLMLTILMVTWLRPAEFRLARELPVTIMRAPELFLPIVIAGLSAVSLWFFARSRSRRAMIGLFVVLALDLFLYGQASAWRTHSPEPQHELWREPEAVKFLRQKEPNPGAYRIFTMDQAFNSDAPVPAPDNGSGILVLQPDIYMMHGIENAAGYDGFGLARYSRFAGDMKVWGELTDAENTLRGDSRVLDLLNVKYLLARSTIIPVAPVTAVEPPMVYGGQRFSDKNLDLPPIRSGRQLSFNLPSMEVERIALLTNLSWSNEIPDHTPVAQIELRGPDGSTIHFELRAGDDASEWAYDRPDIRAHSKHKRAPVGASYPVQDASGKYEAHNYVSAFTLPSRTLITSGSITVHQIKEAPDLSLSVFAITLAVGNRSISLPADWIAARSTSQNLSPGQRWKKISELKDVAIFENGRALPRAWLAPEARVLTEDQILNAVRTAKLPDGSPWDPQRVALLEGSSGFAATTIDPNAAVTITRSEPNRVTLRTKAAAPSILILSGNYFSGWRAYLDGHQVDTLRVDYNLRGVAVPAGEHEVEFVYRPKSVLFGAGISVLTLIGLVAWWKGIAESVPSE